jgi:hypothetical protein
MRICISGHHAFYVQRMIFSSGLNWFFPTLLRQRPPLTWATLGSLKLERRLRTDASDRTIPTSEPEEEEDEKLGSDSSPSIE